MSTRAKDIIRSSLEAKEKENSDQLNDNPTADVVSFQPTTPSREILTLKKNAVPIYEIGDLFVSYLEQIGVEYVFGIPGGAIEPLYNALARSERRGGPRAVVARHETGAAFIADGYSHSSGNLGVCCATTGPGSTNLITGVASAFENNIPLLVITAQTALSTFGKGAFQESSCTGTNTIGMFQHCTKYNSLISHVDQFERKLTSAVMTANQSPCGPVHLSVPMDVFGAPSNVQEPSYDLANLLWNPSMIDEESVEIICKDLKRSNKTVFIIGDEAATAIGTILDVALKLNATVLTTPLGKGLVSPYHPLFKGVVGFAGHESAMRELQDTNNEMIVVVGSPLSEWESNAWDNKLLNSKLIHIDSMESNFTRSPMANLHVRGSLESIFEHIHQSLEQDKYKTSIQSNGEISAGISKINFSLVEADKFNSDETPIKPQRLMKELPNIFPPHTRYLADTGNSFAWGIHYLHPYDRRIAGKRENGCGLFRACLEFASMGWAIGASIGTALGTENTPVVCLTGDGSYLMSSQEISVAIQEKLTVIFIVLNDSELGMVKSGQMLGKVEVTSYQLPNISFAKMAEALDVPSYVIKSPKNLLELDVEEICNRNGPTLIDVHVDPSEIPPMQTRIKVLHPVNS